MLKKQNKTGTEVETRKQIKANKKQLNLTKSILLRNTYLNFYFNSLTTIIKNRIKLRARSEITKSQTG